MALACESAFFILSYSGSAIYEKNWDISTIDVKFEGVVEEISAKIRPERQYLRFEVSQPSEDSIPRILNRDIVVDKLDMLPSIAKTMKLSVRIFKTYTTMNGEMRARRDNLRVSISSFPDFEIGQYYCIRVVNADNELSATFEKIEADSTEVR